jgi:DNA-directed RNA polymerase subunit RPC12/RpoP
MVIYVKYKCGNCGHFELKFKDEEEKSVPFKTPCPKCNSNSGLTKIFKYKAGTTRCG